jgi:hypothetical protein
VAVSFVASNEVFATGANLTATEPTGTASGDIIVALFAVQSGTTHGLPTGWTQLTTSNNSQFEATLGYIVRGASAPSLVFTVGASTYRELTLDSYRGVDNTTPMDVVGQFLGNTLTGTSIDPPAITPSSADTMIVAGGVFWNGNVGGAVAPTNYTRRSGSTNGITVAVVDRLLVGGAGASEDPGTITSTGATTSKVWGFTIALRPASGGGTTQVAATRRVAYNVLANVAATRRVNYSVQAQVAANRRVVYNVLAQVAATRRVAYNVLANVAATRRVNYTVAAGTTQVSTTRRVVYNVLAQVVGTRRVAYNVLAQSSAPAAWPTTCWPTSWPPAAWPTACRRRSSRAARCSTSSAPSRRCWRACWPSWATATETATQRHISPTVPPMPTSEPLDQIPVTTTPDDLVEETVAVTETRVPGAAVESRADKAANDDRRAEPVADTAVPQPDPIIDTRDAVRNLESRDNIVADGPGTVADFL